MPAPKIILPPSLDGYYRVEEIPALLASAIHEDTGLRDLIVGRFVRKGMSYFEQVPSTPIPFDAVDPEDEEANAAIARSATWHTRREVVEEEEIKYLNSLFDRRHGRDTSGAPSDTEELVDEIKEENAFMRELTVLAAEPKLSDQLKTAIGKGNLRAVDPDTIFPPSDPISASIYYGRLLVHVEDLAGWLAVETRSEVLIGSVKPDSIDSAGAGRLSPGRLTLPKVRVDTAAPLAPSGNMRHTTLEEREGPLKRVLLYAIENAGGLDRSNSEIWAQLLALADAESLIPPLLGRVPGDRSKGKSGGVKFIGTSAAEEILTYENFGKRIARFRSRYAQSSRQT